MSIILIVDINIMQEYELKKSNRKGKRYQVKLPSGKIIHFSSNGENYTMHKNKERKDKYINRHKSREDWTKSGIDTAGFWAYWISWNKPTIKESIKDVEKQFGINIKNKI